MKSPPAGKGATHAPVPNVSPKRSGPILAVETFRRAHWAATEPLRLFREVNDPGLIESAARALRVSLGRNRLRHQEVRAAHSKH